MLVGWPCPQVMIGEACLWKEKEGTPIPRGGKYTGSTSRMPDTLPGPILVL